MQTLEQILLAGPDKDVVIAGFVQLVEEHAARRGGLKGMGLRAGLKMLKAAKPGILDRATARLLPEFLQALEPLYQTFRKAKETDFAAFLQRNEKTAATALVAVADRRAAAASPAVKSYYDKFRGSAGEDVQQLIPPLGRLIDQHLT